MHLVKHRFYRCQNWENLFWLTKIVAKSSRLNATVYLMINLRRSTSCGKMSFKDLMKEGTTFGLGVKVCLL